MSKIPTSNLTATGGRFDLSSLHRSNQVGKLHQIGDTEVRTRGRKYRERIFGHRTGPRG